MARARNIKPGFFKNEDLAECTPWARLCFAGLWTLADRAGRLEDRAKRIKGELFAYDSVEVEPLLQELVRYGFIVRYEVEAQRFIQVSKFQEHQTPHYTEKESVIPPPQLPECAGHKGGADSKKTPGVKAPSRGGRYPLNPDSLIPDSPNPEQADPDGSDAAGAASQPAADPPPPPLPPAPPPPKSPDELTRTELWRAGKSLLREQDMPEAQCGTFVGKLVKDYGEAIVIEAVRSAVVQRPADAATWLVGACKAAKGRAGGAGKPGQLTGDQQVAASLAKAQRVAAAMAPKNGAPQPAATPTELIDG
jgi:hypothetical protein